MLLLRRSRFQGFQLEGLLMGTFDTGCMLCGKANSCLKRQKIAVQSAQKHLFNKLKNQEQVCFTWFLSEILWSRPKGQPKKWQMALHRPYGHPDGYSQKISGKRDGSGCNGRQVDVIPPHFFPQGFRVNAADCKGVFYVSKERLCTYQQDTVSSQKPRQPRKDYKKWKKFFFLRNTRQQAKLWERKEMYYS